MERIGRYQVEREVGRGSMSIVYKAFDPRIDRYLAVKVLREQFARDVTSRQRFLREARAAGGLGHPSIITVFDVGQIDGVPYMAMELLDGETLADRLASGRQLGLREVLDLAIQLGSALAYAHHRGVIHRDIKPANIHFDPETGVAKLLDFGIAGIKARQDRDLAAGQVVVGTPAYMAPEQMSGDAQDERCDLYALGVLLYRLLAGRLPFDEGNLGELMAAVVRQPPPPLEPIHPDTPVELVEMTHRLLAKKPSARYASAVEVLEELQDIRSGLNRGLLAAARRKGQAWRWPLAVGAVVALVLLLGLGHVYRSQNEAMAATTFGYGEGLASVIAREVAEPYAAGRQRCAGQPGFGLFRQPPGALPAHRRSQRPGSVQYPLVPARRASTGTRRVPSCVVKRRRSASCNRPRVTSSSRCRFGSRLAAWARSIWVSTVRPCQGRRAARWA
jgi:eukaryotic-like serine/threonine-protein kinase